MRSRLGCEDLLDNDNDEYHDKHDDADNDNKVKDLSLQWSPPNLWDADQLGNLAEDGFISCGYDNTNAAIGHAMCTLKANTFRLEIVLICVIKRS